MNEYDVIVIDCGAPSEGRIGALQLFPGQRLAINNSDSRFR